MFHIKDEGNDRYLHIPLQASKGHSRNVELEFSFSLIYHVHFDNVKEEMTMQNPATQDGYYISI